MQQSGADWRGTLLPSAQTNPSAELFLFAETLKKFLLFCAVSEFSVGISVYLAGPITVLLCN